MLIPNMACFGSLSDEFGQAVVHILARHSEAKIPMGRPISQGMPRKIQPIVINNNNNNNNNNIIIIIIS